MWQVVYPHFGKRPALIRIHAVGFLFSGTRRHVTSQKTGILDYTTVKTSKLTQYTCMGTLPCDVSGDLETLSVGLEPLQIKVTRSFETSGTTYPAATTQRHVSALKTSKNRKVHAIIQNHQCRGSVNFGKYTCCGLFRIACLFNNFFPSTLYCSTVVTYWTSHPRYFCLVTSQAYVAAIFRYVCLFQQNQNYDSKFCQNTTVYSVTLNYVFIVVKNAIMLVF
jgi:hypothetical protein